MSEGAVNACLTEYEELEKEYSQLQVIIWDVHLTVWIMSHYFSRISLFITIITATNLLIVNGSPRSFLFAISALSNLVTHLISCKLCFNDNLQKKANLIWISLHIK